MLGTIDRIKREYFEWKTWDYLYKNMKRRQNEILDRGSSLPYLKKPGIALSFDDSFRVNDWYKYGKELFGYYDVKVTFNINGFNHFDGNREHSQAEIDMLLELQANGHELAHHGLNHRDAVQYTEEVGLNKWIKDEILSMFEWIDQKSHSKTGERFKKPVTFAFPYFNFNDQILKSLVPKYFKIVRGLTFMDDYFTPANHTGLTPSICIDSHYLANPKNVRKVMKFMKQTGVNLILTCHSILPDDVDWEEIGWPVEEHAGRWRSSPEIIQSIINEARNNDLEFYTTAELAGVATFIDRNFENYIREMLKKSSDEWILISELISIRKLDLSNQTIKNLDGIQYFIGLEELILSENIPDQRLLSRLPKYTEVKFE